MWLSAAFQDESGRATTVAIGPCRRRDLDHSAGLHHDRSVGVKDGKIYFMCGKGFDGDIDKPLHRFDVRAAWLGRKQPMRRIPQVCVRGQDRGCEFPVVTLIWNSWRHFRPTVD